MATICHDNLPFQAQVNKRTAFSFSNATAGEELGSTTGVQDPEAELETDMGQSSTMESQLYKLAHLPRENHFQSRGFLVSTKYLGIRPCNTERRRKKKKKKRLHRNQTSSWISDRRTERNPQSAAWTSLKGTAEGTTKLELELKLKLDPSTVHSISLSCSYEVHTGARTSYSSTSTYRYSTSTKFEHHFYYWKLRGMWQGHPFPQPLNKISGWGCVP
ncbi:hypothetical protein BBK36DRAFT_1143667 [Trichoderma citrinoviride]|uniref:Uncharacterized protein n=1 Tax=Trichoderma citrinoviride TaxID=58853 RepID=A0A2T4B438_9HYPO|nr:hypothetical protein BBK36DRAFT_1143667 [Trichoderma citrinoviride]PTB63961.1 hypothetical protein BBK36DRAFT_1143667 [Trichoderma citrinoviride]